ncbi:MAG: UDP-glucose/GDP-mannose dehydrogenase family protein [Candidatus Gracilibacteria bacterium]|nr:UDP-glucose/GDP-mannose dehydrogenase family protein [Candidatus Gracilibacteria bacterium]
MKITIFGTGYVGLVTGTCLAEVGHEVMCIDVDEKKIDDLEKGIIPIYEPGLEELVKRNHKNGRLQFSTNAKVGVDFATAIFSAVGTPPDENHRADLKYVKAVAKTVGKNMTEYKVFINKSTVPVGTGEICNNIIKKECNNINFDIVSNPEFLKEGAAIKDFMVPDRIVCGVESEKAKEVMEKIYKTFVRTNKPLIFTDIKSSEIIKYAANSFLATKISFINEIANFAELAGANISDISKGIGFDPRIGAQFLHAGIGYGGSCFPKDVQALIETGKDFNYDFKIIKATEEVNELQKIKVVEKLKKLFKNSPIIPFHKGDEHNILENKIISIWGLSFKPKTDDIRDAPSIEVIKKLLELGVSEIKLFDPVAIENMRNIFGDNKKITFCSNNYDAIKNSDALIILTEWDEFRNPDFDKIKNLMNGNIIVDGRNIYNKKEMLDLGFIYEGIGKGN